MAHYAQSLEPPRYQPPDPQTQELEARRTRRTQVQEMLVAERNRLRTTPPALRWR
ncbi:MAG: hypothetical protein HY689_04570 [Chloroflexi bacterium]|nr:hypothetical protein [Chloroflexota bacterium]